MDSFSSVRKLIEAKTMDPKLTYPDRKFLENIVAILNVANPTVRSILNDCFDAILEHSLDSSVNPNTVDLSGEGKIAKKKK